MESFRSSKTQIIFRLNNISKNNKREEVYKFDLQGAYHTRLKVGC